MLTSARNTKKSTAFKYLVLCISYTLYFIQNTIYLFHGRQTIKTTRCDEGLKRSFVDFAWSFLFMVYDRWIRKSKKFEQSISKPKRNYFYFLRRENNAIPVATETLRDSLSPAIGISIISSLSFWATSETPPTSFPTIRAIFSFVSKSR